MRENEIEEIIRYAVGHGTLTGAPGINHEALKAKGFTTGAIQSVENALATAFDIRFAFNKWTLGEEFCQAALGLTAEQLERADLRHAGDPRLHQGRDRGREHLLLRRDDAGRRAAPEGRAPAGLRLRQSVRPHRQALPLGREPHPHDGGGAALHLRRHLQDHQHAEPEHGRGLQGRLHAVLAPRPQGERALSRRLQAVAAARQLGARRRRSGRRGDRGAGRRPRPDGRGADRRAHHRAPGRSRAASACRSAARATPRRRSSAATRSTCAPANTRTARSARSSSTCTRKAPPSAA